MRLIDSEELEKRFIQECDGECGTCKYETFDNGVYSCELIKDAPTVEERPHGKWVKSKDGYTRCDQCGSRGNAIKANFCHHCGADMRQEASK